MTTDKGVWNLQQVRDKQLQSLWTYSTSAVGMFTMGENDQGQLGQNNTTKYSSPIQVPGITNWSKVIEGRGKVTGGITSDGELWVWGNNNEGQLGDDSVVDKSSPVQIPGTTWSSVVTSGDHAKAALATKPDGTLWTWGSIKNCILLKTKTADES